MKTKTIVKITLKAIAGIIGFIGFIIALQAAGLFEQDAITFTECLGKEFKGFAVIFVAYIVNIISNVFEV
jgi:uncharacterized membrane protein